MNRVGQPALQKRLYSLLATNPRPRWCLDPSKAGPRSRLYCQWSITMWAPPKHDSQRGSSSRQARNSARQRCRFVRSIGSSASLRTRTERDQTCRHSDSKHKTTELPAENRPDNNYGFNICKLHISRAICVNHAQLVIIAARAGEDDPSDMFLSWHRWAYTPVLE